MSYEFLPHTADVKIRAKGPDLESVFMESAHALREAICGETRVSAVAGRTIEVEGCDTHALLYNFLEEFLYLLDAESFLLSRVTSLRIGKDLLAAEIEGDSAAKYEFSNSVKAVTYNDMKIEQSGDGWIAEFVLDV